MKTLPVAMLLLAFAALGSCQKDDAAPAQMELIGKWQWQSSFCGWGGASSPATTGTTRQLVLQPNGQAELLENGVVRFRSPYTLSRHASFLKRQDADFISFPAQGTEYMYELQNQSLTLAHDAYDGCSETYAQAPL